MRLIFIICLTAVTPIITITALNALGANIPFTFWTWLATFWLHLSVSAITWK